MRRLYALFFLWLSLFIASCNGDDHPKQPESKSTTNISDLQRALKQYPDSALLVQELIQAYRNEGNYDSAISFTKRQTKADTSNAYLWNILATLYYENGDTVHTIDALQRAIAIYPVPEYYVALGTVFAEVRNKHALTIADLLLNRLSEKNFDDAYFIKGLYYNYSAEPQKAILMLDSCLAMNYTYMYAYREKGIALYDLKKYREAIKVLKRAVTLQNNFDEGYFWMGKVYEKLDMKDSAIVAYQNALLYDKNFVEAKNALDNLTKTQ